MKAAGWWAGVLAVTGLGALALYPLVWTVVTAGAWGLVWLLGAGLVLAAAMTWSYRRDRDHYRHREWQARIREQELTQHHSAACAARGGGGVMSDLGDLIARVPLGELPATITVPVGEYVQVTATLVEARQALEQANRKLDSTGRERAHLIYENERLTAELDSARDSLNARTAALVRAREAVRYGDALCPRCGEALAAEVAAEKENTDG